MTGRIAKLDNYSVLPDCYQGALQPCGRWGDANTGGLAQGVSRSWVVYRYLSFAWNGGSEKDHTKSRLKSSAWMFYQIADIRFQVQLTQSASTQPQCRWATAAGVLLAQHSTSSKM